MKLFILGNTNPLEFDTYNSVVVAAPTAKMAAKTPVGSDAREWCEKPTVKYIGIAKKGTKPGIIHVNFHNG